MTSSNERQVGGSHYAGSTIGEIQHWDYAWLKFGRGYFQGQITKYVERYHKKNGVQDLQKALHFLEKLIELESEIPVGQITTRTEPPRCRFCAQPFNTAHLNKCTYRIQGDAAFVDLKHCDSEEGGPTPGYVSQD